MFLVADSDGRGLRETAVVSMFRVDGNGRVVQRGDDELVGMIAGCHRLTDAGAIAPRVERHDAVFDAAFAVDGDGRIVQQ